jgi:hypothetical protein
MGTNRMGGRMSVIDLLLESEGHVPYEPGKHNKLHFQMCRLVKDEIREHKWIEGEKGRNLTWEEAVKEWMDEHYDAFIKAVVPKSRINAYPQWIKDELRKI